MCNGDENYFLTEDGLCEKNGWVLGVGIGIGIFAFLMMFLVCRKKCKRRRDIEIESGF